MKRDRNPGRPSWTIRRRIIHATLLFCAGMVIWIVLRDQDTSVAETVVTSSFILAGSVIGAYVFGAAWDDANVMRHMGPRAYDDLAPPVPPSDPSRDGEA